MASIRLEQWMRESILAAVLHHRYDDVYKGFVADWKALAEDVYNDLYDKATQRKMKRLPEGWLPENNHLTVAFGDAHKDYISLEFDGTMGLKDLHKLCPKGFVTPKAERRILYTQNKACARKYDAKHPLAVRYFAILNGIERAIIERDVASKEAERILKSVTTMKRLKEVWPEVWPFAKKYNVERQLPVVKVDTLNQMFKLPVEGANP